MSETQNPEGGDAELPDAVAPPPGHERFPLIDGARAIAATSIVVFHAGGASGLNDDDFIGELTGAMSLGVPLFFLISGFLLYRPFVAARLASAPSIRTLPYLWRRALRIIPLYWFVLTVVFVATAGATDREGGFFSGEPWWLFYAFGQVYVPEAQGGGLEQAWTLCIELTFYLALPVYAAGVAAMYRRGMQPRHEAALLALLAVISLAFIQIVVISGGQDHLGRTLPAQFFLFSLGMGLALLSVQITLRSKREAVQELIGGHSALIWLLAAAGFLLWALWINDSRSLFSGVFGGLVALLILVPAVVSQEGSTPARFLANRQVAWVGLVSYGLYLWHVPAISAIENSPLGSHLDGLLGFAGYLLLGFGLACIAAAFTYYQVEAPVLKLKRRPPRFLQDKPSGKTHTP